jgi:CheY-like chemotaxis protein
MTDHKSVTIVLVEDDPGHARLIEKNLRRANITNDIIKLDDGRKTLDFFFPNEERRTFFRLPLPMLVLLDLNIPVIDGYQVLGALKENPRTRNIPVIILTTTDDPREVERCYELGCNIYVTKPVDYEKFSEAINKVGLFLSVVTVPGE